MVQAREDTGHKYARIYKISHPQRSALLHLQNRGNLLSHPSFQHQVARAAAPDDFLARPLVRPLAALLLLLVLRIVLLSATVRCTLR